MAWEELAIEIGSCNLIDDRCGEDEGIKIADNICRVILYADDLAIMCESPSGLQNMLGYLEEFCQIYMMEVNTTKSEVVVFNSNLLIGRMELQGL